MTDRRPSQWPLRRRLVFALVGILVLLTVAIGAVSVSVQRQSLVNRLDDQLRQSLEMASRPGDVSGRQSPGVPGPRLGSLEVVLVDGQVTGAELVDDAGTTHELTEDEIRVLLEGAGTPSFPQRVDLGEHGSFRVVAAEVAGTRSGAGTSVIIVGHSLAEVQQTTRDLTVIFTLVGLVGVVLAAVAGGYLVRLGLRPLDRLAATATRVSATPLASGEVALPERVPERDAAPGTEVGQVGAAFNQMLDHVEYSLRVRHDSEERLRRFVADASHELRTPLAAVSGYAELAARQAGQLPDDVAHSLERIGSESARMTSMVQDLLLLARLDSGATLAAEPVALATVVVDACSDARVTGPDHIWQLELDESAAEIDVMGDAGRLHQVVSNLLTNARVHTPPGTRVTARLATVDGTHAELQVEDDGPGIPEELQARIFDRFVRGDDSRSRASGSTGLGMSIVEAIVTAHHGSVAVDSRPGRTVFTVRLPLAQRP
ncbi:sensor histidine kinase [Propionibacteriaceae bacterium Y1923]